ncbi:MAG TPA: hypothetical protein VGC74_02340 [Stenotrophomonas sp.]|jgi:hypothetical protein
MKHTCQLCRHFCSTIEALQVDGPPIGMIGPCCQSRAAERVDRLRERHPERVACALTMAEFRDLTRPDAPTSPYWMRLKPKWPPVD